MARKREPDPRGASSATVERFGVDFAKLIQADGPTAALGQDLRVEKLGGAELVPAHPATSLRLIASTGVGKEARIVDAGGGDSLLVDKLLDHGFRDVAVIDVSTHALQRARERLGDRARRVNWICGDVLEFHPAERFDVWHDRAVFHFLTDMKDRAAYVRAVLQGLRPGGHLIIATFGPEAPPKCSGLDVVRYSPESLADAFGAPLELVASVRQLHISPGGVEQPFNFCRFVAAEE